MRERIIWIPANSTPQDLLDEIRHNEGRPRYIRVQTPCKDGHPVDLLREGLTNRHIRGLLVSLANHGYSLYFNNCDENRFIRHDRISHHWRAVKDGPLNVSESGIMYEYEPPLGGSPDHLVVVFSPISSAPRLRRFYWRSFGSLGKYIATNTGILRIADLGGIKGAFYLNTTFLPDNATRIQSFIRRFASRLGVDSARVVLYGASKGGTGATYHGLQSGFPFVAVDPILSDSWYEEQMGDYHYTSGGVFPSSKQTVFGMLIDEVSRRTRDSRRLSVVVTSARSPQYETVLATLRPVADSLLILNSLNPNIKEHPDVAPNTIYAQLMAINASITGVGLPAGARDIA